MIDIDKPLEFGSEVVDTDQVRDDDIPQMIDDVLDRGCSESFEEFLESLRSFYTKNNYLTVAQYDALERSWQRTHRE